MNNFIFALVFIVFSLHSIDALPRFTGHADVDFAESNPYLTANDLAGKHVFNRTTRLSVIRAMSNLGRRSGIDIDAIHTVYDDKTDSLYVGIQCAGICGDIDGNGDETTVEGGNTAVFGTEGVDLCISEGISTMFWNQVPLDYQVNLSTPFYFFPTMVVGVDIDKCIITAQGDQEFSAYEFKDYKNCAWPTPRDNLNNPCINTTADNIRQINSGIYPVQDLPTQTSGTARHVPPPQVFALYPNSSFPHIEFVLANFSLYPEFTFTPGVAGSLLRFGITAASTSSTDKNGEDRVQPEVWQVSWDCFGTMGGKYAYDACGVCNGTNTTCMDCAFTPNGNKSYDICGVCGGKNNTCGDCFGIPNGPNKYDKYGICNGTGLADCFGNPFGKAKYDVCGVCNGDGSSCACLNYLGYDLENVDYALLRWTVTASIVKIADTLQVLHSIKDTLPGYDYTNNSTSLSEYIDEIHDFCDDCLDNFDTAQAWFAEYLSGSCDGINCESLESTVSWTL